MNASAGTSEQYKTLTKRVCARLALNQRVRRTLPDHGRIHVDRQLPFLCVYRQPPDREDVGTRDFVKAEASYLVGSGVSSQDAGVRHLLDGVAATLSPEFGAFLLVEIWSGPDEGRGTDHRVPEVAPRFCVQAPPSTRVTSTVEALVGQLKKIKVLKQAVAVDVLRQDHYAPPGMPPLLSTARLDQLGCVWLGLQLPPVWRDVRHDRDYPLLMRTMIRQVSQALRRAIYEFVQGNTTHRPSHYHELGRRAVVRAVWDVDRQLAAVSGTFDFLRQVTPVNTDAAWTQFQASNYDRIPDFHYLPTPVDPAILKRQLYQVPIERVEDPALHHLFREKCEELDRRITMLRDRNTPSFLLGSLQLFGTVSNPLYELAMRVLGLTAKPSVPRAAERTVSAVEFAQLAEAEIAHYRASCPDFAAQVQVSTEVAGMMVSGGKLLVNKHFRTPLSRVNALLQHEVGTHLLTYYNGRAQPFRQLESGLAGYDELQEGLAVLAEYLVGGLSRERMRQLAARVVAARHLVDGATFIDTFRVLRRDYGFRRRQAFSLTMRIYRGGGLTKDIVYLRGLQVILDYLGQRGDLDTLFVGKMATHQIPIIRELLFRKVLQPAPLRPRYLDEDATWQRLRGVQEGLTVAELLEQPA